MQGIKRTELIPYLKKSEPTQVEVLIIYESNFVSRTLAALDQSSGKKFLIIQKELMKDVPALLKRKFD
jgi:16S rRNA C1402 (ribose-2'-O) methylase RsmI